MESQVAGYSPSSRRMRSWMLGCRRFYNPAKVNRDTLSIW